MSTCDALLDFLERDGTGELPADLLEHATGCAACRLALERTTGLADGASVLRDLHAPDALKERLKSLRRLAPACERAIELAGAALDGALDDEVLTELMDHLHACSRCLAVWEAFATLREVGAVVRAPSPLRAALALPPRQRIAVRRTRRIFDLRLATAAAYLLAALAVVLLSDPATVARASSERMDKAVVYTSAVVENRLASYSRRIGASIAAAEGWARQRATDTWVQVRHLFGGSRANQSKPSDVSSSGNGGRT
jgi:hypothetical protein